MQTIMFLPVAMPKCLIVLSFVQMQTVGCQITLYSKIYAILKDPPQNALLIYSLLPQIGMALQQVAIVSTLRNDCLCYIFS